jgi:hypothetical protein
MVGDGGLSEDGALRTLGLALLGVAACAGTEEIDAPIADARLDAPVVVYDARYDAPKADARGLVIRSDGRVLRDAAPVPDGGPPDAPPLVDAPIMIDAPTPPCDVQLLANGGFDQSTGSGTGKNITPWIQDPDDVVVTAAELAINGQPAPQAGNYAAWLGGDIGRVDFVYQAIAVPAATRSLRLDGYMYVRTNEPVPATHDRLFVNVYNTNQSLLDTVATYYERDETSGWESFTLNIPGNYAGRTILLAFESENGFVYATSFFLDTLTVTARVCQ